MGWQAGSSGGGQPKPCRACCRGRPPPSCTHLHGLGGQQRDDLQRGWVGGGRLAQRAQRALQRACGRGQAGAERRASVRKRREELRSRAAMCAGCPAGRAARRRQSREKPARHEHVRPASCPAHAPALRAAPPMHPPREPPCSPTHPPPRCPAQSPALPRCGTAPPSCACWAAGGSAAVPCGHSRRRGARAQLVRAPSSAGTGRPHSPAVIHLRAVPACSADREAPGMDAQRAQRWASP